MTPIHIQFTRFSAFYSPLILTIAGGYLKDQGLTPERGFEWSKLADKCEPRMDVHHEGTKDTKKKTHHRGTETQRFFAIVASGYS